jgi:hypothetical protein
LVSIRQGLPCSIREIVIGDTFASLASSDLLINRDSRIFFKELFAMFNFLPIRVLKIISTGPVKVIPYDPNAYYLFILLKKGWAVK